MRRRRFLRSLAVGAGLGVAGQRTAEGAAADPSSTMKISRVRLFAAPFKRPVLNQSTNVVVVETDQGLAGFGEGGAPDSFRECAGLLIGQDASRIEYLWQLMYRGFFYPPGREKLHALGALDMALWDLKGKALGVPVYELLGGLSRLHLDCYSTGFPGPGGVKESARACIEAGFRAFRTSVSDGGDGKTFDARAGVRHTYEKCQAIREGVGDAGGWVIDFHTRLDMNDAVRLSKLIEDLEPIFVEDLIRSENPAVYRQVRPQVKIPIAVGEQFGDRWDINQLVEERLIDYSRVTLPNCGGITEMMKIAALCETHYVGFIPHFTGPISTAALVHVCSAFPGPVLAEMTGNGHHTYAHLPQHFDFRDGKLWPNRRPGLGVELDMTKLTLLDEVTEFAQPIPVYRRPDGSITNW